VAHAENEVVIGRAAGEIYTYLADGLNNPAWRSGVLSIELKSGTAAAVGAVYRQLLRGPGGRAIDGDYEITEAIPGSELRFRVVAGPARPVGAYLLTPLEGGTRVRFTLDLAPKGLMRLMGAAITKTMESEVAQLARLKAVLES
jgi:Predicted integral membrane protein